MSFTVSIIGCGYSGNAILHHLAHSKLDKHLKSSKLTINVFEKSSRFGDGAVYNLDNNHVLINSPPRTTMSIDYKNMKSFSDWIDKQGIHYNEFVLRKDFGRYLLEQLEKATKELTNLSVTINFIPENVISIQQVNSKNFMIFTTFGNSFEANFVILSIGHGFQKNHFHISGGKYINDLYLQFNKLDLIKKNEKVLIIGSGLSALDCILYLNNCSPQKTIYCSSRSGIIPKVRIYAAPLTLVHIPKLLSYKHLTIKEILKHLDMEIQLYDPTKTWKSIIAECNKLCPYILEREINKKNDILQLIMISLRPYLEPIWFRLYKNDKIKFIKKIFLILSYNRFPMPRNSAIFLKQLLSQGILINETGNIKNIKYNKDKKKFWISFYSGKLLSVDWIINATGQSNNISNDPLCRNLLTSGLIKLNIAGGIEIDTLTQSCINSHNNININFKAIGAKTFGSYINISSADDLSMKAEIISNEIIKAIARDTTVTGDLK